MIRSKPIKKNQKQNSNDNFVLDSKINEKNIISEPIIRVFPGRLSVARTFGDIYAKNVKYGGRPGVIIAVPDIKTIQIQESSDFIFMGSDGIFDKLSNEDIAKIIWSKGKILYNKGKNIHTITGECVKAVIKEAMHKKSSDNVTGILIIFKGFTRKLKSIARKFDVKARYKNFIINKVDNKNNIKNKRSSLSNSHWNELNNVIEDTDKFIKKRSYLTVFRKSSCPNIEVKNDIRKQIKEYKNSKLNEILRRISKS